MKDSPKRLDTAKEVFKSMGAEIKAFYLAMGRYDAVVIGEAPDDETATKMGLNYNVALPFLRKPANLTCLIGSSSFPVFSRC